MLFYSIYYDFIIIHFSKYDSSLLNFSCFKGETIRFRITSESFQETSPGGPPGLDQSSGNNTTSNIVDGTNNCKTPYRLLASINEPGLGLLTWWENQDDGADREIKEED